MTFHSLLASTALGMMLGAAAPALAETAPSVSTAAYTQIADTYALPLGDFEIVALSDGTVPQDLHELLTATTDVQTDKLLSQAFLSNPVEASVNAYLIRDGARHILVDTGAGQLFGPGFGGKLYDSLASIGVKPEDITDILITHIHTDHTGGLVIDGKPAFPNATIYVGAPDLAFFLDPSNSEETGYARQYFDEAAMTIGIYEKIGKVKTFSGSETILPGIVATIHPGHTPGSAFYTVSSAGQSMVFVGDIIHVAAVQFPEPGITITYDVDPGQAQAVRKEAFSEFADERQLIAAPHLPFPGIGHIRAEGAGSFSWFPVEYRNRAGH